MACLARDDNIVLFVGGLPEFGVAGTESGELWIGNMRGFIFQSKSDQNTQSSFWRNNTSLIMMTSYFR